MSDEDAIIKILKKYELYLSDGYGYYCNPKKWLPKIAQEIIEAIK